MTDRAAHPALEDLNTPCLLLDRTRLIRNVDRLRARMDGLGVSLRTHLKTLKCVQAARLVLDTPTGPATVSTLKEAEVFAQAGVRDMIYAVGIAPSKLDRVLAVRAAGADLAIVLDSLEAARAVADRARRSGDSLPTLIEIDCDGHRSGLRPDQADLLLACARTLDEGGAEVRGVLTHAGGSYSSRGAAALAEAARRERDAVVASAAVLRGAGLACPVVSVGSTPTAHFARDLTGVTEVRAGVFTTFDLVMAGLGVCTTDDIAMSVLATVIGHQREKGWILVDAGWMALSRDRGTADQTVDQGYGLACDLEGKPYRDLIVADANQEHGILAVRPGSDAALPELPLGSRVRILPIHACATGAQFDGFHVLGTRARRVQDFWPRFSGW